MELNLTSPKTVRNLLNEYSLAPLKSKGQNFLIDGNIADKTARAAIPEGAFALEIGPGLGALTQRLLARAGKVFAYEIDSGLVRALREIFAGESRLSLMHEDFLKADIESDLAETAQQGIYVAASLPYYITTDCILKLLDSRLNIKSITVIVQKEFADKACARPGDKDYCALSAACSLSSDARILFTVPPGCFYPEPKVGSAALGMRINEAEKEETKERLSLVKALFSARRKTVKNNLQSAFGLRAEEAQDILKDSGIDINARAENLSVIEIKKLHKNLKSASKYTENRLKSFKQ